MKSKDNFLDYIYIPVPGLVWREEDGTVILDVENRGFFNFLAQKAAHRPRVSHISLDAYGSVLWKHLDGRNTVFDLAEIMKASFPDEKDDMLKRVVHFIRTLLSVHYIQKSGTARKEDAL